MGKVPATWKTDESFIAAQLTTALDTEREYDHVCKRIPLSGSNNRRTDGTPHHGDISLPDAYDCHIELKRRASFSHQSLMDAAKEDATKHGITNSILITKQLRQRGFTVLLDSGLFFKMLAIPGVKELLKRDDRHPVNTPKSRKASRSPEVRARNQGVEEDHQDLREDRGEDTRGPR